MEIPVYLIALNLGLFSGISQTLAPESTVWDVEDGSTRNLIEEEERYIELIDLLLELT